MGLLGLILLALWTGGASAAPPLIPKHLIPIQTFVANPERVSDGDTVVYPAGICRLIGVDAPEIPHPGKLGQPMGQQATEALRGELQTGPNTVLVYGKDKYGRFLCAILDSQGYLVNLMLVESGLAEAYFLDKAPFAEGFRAAEARAKQQKLGVWGLPKYERPEDYRKRMKHPQP